MMKDDQQVESETTGLLAGMDLERFIQLVGEAVGPRCKRHRKDPSCVVGEHKHCPLASDPAAPPPQPPPSLFGDVETLSLLLP